LIPSVRLAKWYLQLMPVTPPAYFESPKPLERAIMEYEDEQSPSGFHSFFALDHGGKDILDLGCGYGGRSIRYKELGARSIAGVEIAERMVQEARQFSRQKGFEIDARVATGEHLPFADESFDAIYSYDVFEHVESLEATLRECYRVLRKRGTLYAVFPPFYHPTGGSHLHGYLSRSPLPHLLFPCKTLVKAITQLKGAPPDMRATDPLPTVNGTTIAKLRKITGRVPFSKTEVRLRPLRGPGRLRFLNPVTRVMSRLPLLREISTGHILLQCTK
jgi:SAM-dependent methyltransferase